MRHQPIMMLFFVCMGVYGVNNNVFDVFVLIVSGVVGYGMIALQLPVAPLLLGFILGPLMEEHLRRAMLISDGQLTMLADTWISMFFLCGSILLVAISAFSAMRARRLRTRLVETES